MKNLVSIVLTALLLTITCSGLAEERLTVVSKNLIEFDAESSGYFFAKVRNTGDTGVYVGSGKMVGFSANDDILVSESYVTAMPYGIYLKPGEYAYIRELMFESALEAENIVDYKYSTEISNYGTDAETIPCEVRFEIEDADSYDNYVYVTFANKSSEVLYNCYVVAALYDENDDLIFVNGNSYDNLGIHPDSTVTIKLYIDNDLAKHYRAHGMIPTKADAIVYITE